MNAKLLKLREARKQGAILAARETWGMRHGDDLEIDDEPLVSMDNDDIGVMDELERGCFVAAWVWIDAETINAHTETEILDEHLPPSDEIAALEASARNVHDVELGAINAVDGIARISEIASEGQVSNLTNMLASALKDALPYLGRAGYDTSQHDPVRIVERTMLHALRQYDHAMLRPVALASARCRECGETFPVPAVALCPACDSRYIAHDDEGWHRDGS